MQSRAKAFIINHLLDLVRETMPLSQAHILLLGGVGFEADLCLKRGIPERHLNIVERSPSRMRGLMRRFPEAFTIQANINSVMPILRSLHGRQTRIDYMHLDLCGTLDPVEQALDQLIRLSSGKEHCLAVTVADQRVHRAITDPETTLEQSKELFGRHAESILQSLLDLHNFVRDSWDGTEADPAKVAMRELSIYNHIARACGLGTDTVVASPDLLQRLIFSAGGFRMRTYFFHLKSGAKLTPDAARQQFVHLIQASSCAYLISGQLVNVPLPQPQKEILMNRRQEVSKLREALQPVMEMAGEKVQSALSKLFELAESDAGYGQAISAMEAALQKLKQNCGEQGDAAPEPTGGSEPTNSATPEGAATPSPEETSSTETGTVTFTPIEVSEDLAQKDKVRLLILKARSVPDETGRQQALDDAMRKAIKMLKLGDVPNPGNKIRGIEARSNGGFRPEFVARQLLQHPDGVKRDNLLLQLSRYYGEQPEIILREAKKTRFWKRAYAK